MSLSLALSKEVLTLEREPIDAEFAELLVKNVKQMVHFLQ